eukprot:4699576-Karenia_brevis.AAC.1
MDDGSARRRCSMICGTWFLQHAHSASTQPISPQDAWAVETWRHGSRKRKKCNRWILCEFKLSEGCPFGEL